MQWKCRLLTIHAARARAAMTHSAPRMSMTMRPVASSLKIPNGAMTTVPAGV